MANGVPLDLPARSVKPRDQGITHLMDRGLAVAEIDALMEVAGDSVDIVKLGFGTGRSGHTHQGHDVFAACGTPLVAARGGTVRYKAFQGRAGNYVVIDGDGTDVDYAYMHLQGPALFDKGERVLTGQRIGNVGDTGDAHGCHLHFEAWSGPGWYEGGKPFDPLPLLRAWDSQSGALTR